MNIPYLLKIKFLLRVSSSKEIFDWAFQQVEQGDTNSELLEMLSLREDDNSRIIEKLSKIANFQKIDETEVKEYFYSLFIEMFEKSTDVVVLEGLLVKFYNLVKDDIHFNEDERLSFSIIENDLSLRESNLPFQINKNAIFEFLKNERQLGD
ncbi:MAG: hypothetical protein QM781_13135 [Chitinophagaceae bacterium]